MTKIEWINILQDYILRTQNYETAASIREIGKLLINSGESDDLLTREFFDSMIEKMSNFQLFYYKFAISEKIINEITTISLPFLREDKINNIIE